jgi:hypothetical protein
MVSVTPNLWEGACEKSIWVFSAHGRLQGKVAYLFSPGNSWANMAKIAVLSEPIEPKKTKPLFLAQ